MECEQCDDPGRVFEHPAHKGEYVTLCPRCYALMCEHYEKAIEAFGRRLERE